MIKENIWYKFKNNTQIPIIIIINVVIAIYNPVLTYCISDLRIRNSSRIVEIVTASLLLIPFIFLFFSPLKFITALMDIAIGIIQLFIIVYIMILLLSNCGIHVSAKVALSGASITFLIIIISIIDYFVTKKKKAILIKPSI
ncbi:MAG: hypothetical protein FK734_14205 [Asgard group archaeon]|nr:hypothetical protein [Asgard group archaeon]